MARTGKQTNGARVRDLFRGYYQATTDETSEIWADGKIALDANVLLSLYKVLPTTSDLYLTALEARKNQMWIPYQIGLEFHRNVHVERSKQTIGHQERIKSIDSFLDELRKTAKKSRLQSSSLQEAVEENLKALKEQLETESRAIAEQTHHHTHDALLQRIADLFAGRVGSKPSPEALEKMHTDAARRFEDEVPPGYEDPKTKAGPRKYGDYVLWRQVLDVASEMKSDFIFVTDDDKPDWWLKDDKKRSIAPRPELIQEFRAETGQEILILNSSQFYNRLMSDSPGTADQGKLVQAAEEDMSAAVTESQSLQLQQSIRDLLMATSFNEEAEQLSAYQSIGRRTIAPSVHRGIGHLMQESDSEELRRSLRREDSKGIRAVLVEQYSELEERLALLGDRRVTLANDLRFQNDRYKRAILRKRLDRIESEVREIEERMAEYEYSMSMMVDSE